MPGEGGGERYALHHLPAVAGHPSRHSRPRSRTSFLACSSGPSHLALLTSPAGLLALLPGLSPLDCLSLGLSSPPRLHSCPLGLLLTSFSPRLPSVSRAPRSAFLPALLSPPRLAFAFVLAATSPPSPLSSRPAFAAGSSLRGYFLAATSSLSPPIFAFFPASPRPSLLVHESLVFALRRLGNRRHLR
jgi:hypothetical protein